MGCQGCISPSISPPKPLKISVAGDMASCVARSLFRRTSRFYVASTFNPSHGLPYSSSSLPSSSQSASFVGRAQTQSAWQLPLFTSPRFTSSNVEDDGSLIEVLQSEIDCVQEPKDPRDINVPKDFPFEIIDRHSDQTITLKRKYGSENIQVTVYMNIEGEQETRENDDDDDQEATIQPRISLHITVDKMHGFILEFVCNLSSKELEIESMASKSRDDFDDQRAYQGPEFSDLDESLQKALRKYLEVRGIKSSLHSFLYEYMTNKDERQYLKWLKNLKKFFLI